MPHTTASRRGAPIRSGRFAPWALLLLLTAGSVSGADQTIDPTFIRRSLSSAHETQVAISSTSAHYRPLFGDGDADGRNLLAVTRFGELKVDAGGRSARVSYPDEEHILVILSGVGSVSYQGRPLTVKAGDYIYLPPSVEFGLDGGSAGTRAILMGYAVPKSMPVTVPAKPMLANISEVPRQSVASHPSSTQYQLLMGATGSTRDKLAAGHLMVSLFVMEIAPGGTNFPHHHEHQEEIYLLLNGAGQIVAGGGLDGIAGKFPAVAGDAYYYRPNTTVGFYNDPHGEPARILAVRNGLPPGR